MTSMKLEFRSSRQNPQACEIFDASLRKSLLNKITGFETYLRLSSKQLPGVYLINRFRGLSLNDDLPIVTADFRVWCIHSTATENVSGAAGSISVLQIANLVSLIEKPPQSYYDLDLSDPIEPLHLEALKSLVISIILTEDGILKEAARLLKEPLVLSYIKSLLSNRSLRVGQYCVVDLRDHDLAKGQFALPPISYLYVEGCEYGNIGAGLKNVIGKIVPETTLSISDVRNVNYYKRLHQNSQMPAHRSAASNRIYEALQSRLKAVPFHGFSNFCNGHLIAATSTSSAKSVVVQAASALCANILELNLSSTPVSNVTNFTNTITQVFSKAIDSATVYPTIVILEDVEILASSSGKSETNSLTELNKSKGLAHLCNTVDLLGHVRNLLVTVVTSKPHLIPARLRIPGRLQQEIYIPLPKQQERQEIIGSLVAVKAEFDGIDLSYLAELTPGYDNADLERLISTISLKAQENGEDAITISHIKYSITRVIPSVLRGSIGVVDLHRESSLDDIVGLESVKLHLIKAIVWPLKHPDAFLRLGIQPPKGILLFGPPGCAKTTLVRSIANSHQTNFLSVSAAELYSSGVGDSEKIIADLFHRARLASPCVLFIDELEAIVGSREGSSGGSRKANESILSTFLTEIDGIGTKSSTSGRTTELDLPQIILVAATNRPDMIDSALLRPGRLDRLIPVPPPSEQDRFALLTKCTSKTPLHSSVNLMQIARDTCNYSGADMVNLCNEAALLALEEDMNIQSVSMDHLMKSKAQSTPSITAAALESFHRQCEMFGVQL